MSQSGGNPQAYDRVDFTTYIVVSIWFGCNNQCRICMLSDLKKELPPIGYTAFQKLCTDIIRDGRYRNLILSGAEVTTCDDLEKYIRFAASLGWFKKIQIQTNGRRLRDKAYLQRLITSGANEFFVSIHGLGEDHDAMTGRPGSFEEAREGLENLASFDVNVITNSVLTNVNVGGLPQLIRFFTSRLIREIHLWNFFPMEKLDSRELIVGMDAFCRLLPEFLDIAKGSNTALVFKGFPECLSTGEPGFFDSFFPETILPDKFWNRFNECGFGTCVYKNICTAEGCWGLSHAYINKYGDERNRLTPFT